ncbi:MAG: hypothetical protein ACLQPD_27945 [Desulfomonilaceae bacterium]
MLRHLKLVLCGCLVASLCSFFWPSGNLALAQSAEDWMNKGKEAYQAAQYEKAALCYSKALEMDPKSVEKLVEKQEAWVLERVASGQSADLLERIGEKLADESLPLRKDLIEKYDKELIIRASFLDKLVTDFNDFKVYPKGINIKNAIIVGDLDLSNIEVSPPVSISKSIFFGEMRLDGSQFQRVLSLEGSHFLKAVNANRMKVDRDAFFNRAVFRGPVTFNGANTGWDFMANGARFESKAEAIFDSLDVGQYAFFNRAVFRGPVTFNGAHVGRDFRANGARFEGNAAFNSLKVDRDTFLNEGEGNQAPIGSGDLVIFWGKVDFAGAHIGRDFRANGARFEGNAEATFNSLVVGQYAVFTKAVFRGPVDFLGATIASNFYAQGARFESKESEATKFNFKVGGSAFFANAVFQGGVNFGAANIASYFSAKGARFESTKSKADFNTLKVGQAALFGKAVFKGPVGLSWANMGDLHLEGTEFQESKEITLEGLTYKNIYTEDGGYSDYKKVLAILRHIKRYSPEPYKQLESYYVGRGDKEAADEVFVEGKRRELREKKGWQPTDFLTHFFLDRMVVYGRDLNRVIWLVLGFIGLGTLIFSRPKMFKDEEKLRLWRAIWYSLSLFIPFATLGADKFHVIDKTAYFNLLPRKLATLLPVRITTWLRLPVEFYYYVHQLFGYILLSIGIAAVAGIIK